jgi:hypothetical protein
VAFLPPKATITCFEGSVNRNSFCFPFSSFHITTCFGLYRPSSGEIYTIVFKSHYAYSGSVFRLYSLLCHVIYYNLKFEVKVAGNILKIAILYKNVVLLRSKNGTPQTSHTNGRNRMQPSKIKKLKELSSSLRCLLQWYWTFFVRVPPDVIYLQLCTLQSCWFIIQVIHSL